MDVKGEQTNILDTYGITSVPIWTQINTILRKWTHKKSINLPRSLLQVWVIMWQIMNLLGVLGVGVALGKCVILITYFSRYSLALILANAYDLESYVQSKLLK